MVTRIKRKRSTGPRAGVGGRPSTYSQEVADKILQLIADGVTVTKACEQTNVLPRTMLGWCELNAEFDQNLERARRIGFTIRAEAYGQKADDALDGVQGAGKDEGPAVSAASALANHCRWNMEKLSPKVYGAPVMRVEQKSEVVVKDGRDALRDKILAAAEGKPVEAQPPSRLPH